MSDNKRTKSPSELRSKKADKTGDNMEWLPIDLVAELLEEMKAGKVHATHMVVLMWDETDKGMRTFEWRAGVSRAEEVAMLDLYHHKLIGRWGGTNE